MLITRGTSTSPRINGGDTGAPTVVSGVIPADGLTIALTMSEKLKWGLVHEADDFTLNGTSSVADSVALVGETFTITVDTAILMTDTVTVDYTQDGPALQDEAGNEVADFADQAITNNSTQT